jgi:hypothetical protein
MKRIGSLIAICLLAGAVPALAGEGTHYAGPIEDNHKGAMSFDYVKTVEGRFVRNVEFQIHVKCGEKSGTLSVETKGRFRVRHRNWEGTNGTFPTEISDGGKVSFAGKLKDEGKAKGTIEFRDRAPELGDCTSRTRDWTALEDPF